MSYRSLRHVLVCSAFVLLSACQSSQSVGTDFSTVPSEREASLMRQAQATQKAGDVQSALALYQEAAALSHGAIEAHLQLALLLQSQGDLAGAQEVLNQAQGINAKHPAIDLQLGKLAVQQNRPDAALEHFANGLGHWPQSIDLLNGKGVALDMMRRHDEAQAAYLQAIGQGKAKTEFVRNNLAMSYIMSDRYKDAIETLEGIENIQGTPVMRQNLALAYGLKGDMEAARQWAQPDLTKEQLEENIAFYRSYKKELAAHKKPPAPAKPAPVKKEEPAAKKATKEAAKKAE